MENYDNIWRINVFCELIGDFLNIEILFLICGKFFGKFVVNIVV